MESSNASTGEFEAAIKNFSKISLEVDSLINLGNADAHKIMNKSMVNRTEATRRLTSFAAEQKGTKSKESIQTLGTLEQLFKAEVELEFDNGVAEQKELLRGNKVENNSKPRELENKKSESVDEESGEDEDSEEEESSEESDDESSDEESTDKESTDTDKESSEEEDDGASTENESTDEEVPVEKIAVENVTDSSKK